jgi:hypothetical protein
MAIKAGTIILATDNSKDGRAFARQWLKDQGYTPEQVRLYELDGQTLAQAIVDLG